MPFSLPTGVLGPVGSTTWSAPSTRAPPPRLARLLLGAVVAAGRRTVTAWLRSAGLTPPSTRPAYAAVAAAGRRADLAAALLVHGALKPLLAGSGRLLLAIDDTPTERSGPKVQGAGLHHNPAPGRAGGPFVYGHSWVVLGWLARHPTWGSVALPLLARLDVRRTDLPAVPASARPAFRTKLELAAEVGRLGRGSAAIAGAGRSGWRPTAATPRPASSRRRGRPG